MNYQSVLDEQLLTFLKEDDAEAFKELYNRYWYKLFSVAYHKIGMKEEAEELVHDVFESIWNKRQQLVISHLGAYLVVAIKHLSTNYIKSQINYRKLQEHLIFHQIQQSFSTEELVNFSELSEALKQVMKKLPEQSSEIFKLSRFENQSVKDIASRLNISEKAVEYHITKSIKLLKEDLKAYHNYN
ncbi:RNA polymerase sigma factor [Spirosoma endbachense]|jgi:RNA polymerase sigma-70 factor (family 1)|uniref:RNA polymerase sigma-70 factor n=1 Tax=Spirosoma endbachense TaxID=2666025 RepID=A0A6P1VVV3_9BACT|nr:RNA polymerase sigma-70 factor [Spirosoma endbachense]QHV95799.1 RNA polymerase sigma-70 factor [Spirosoma endbachense]